MIKVDFELRFGVTIFASQNEAQLCVRQNRVRSLFFFHHLFRRGEFKKHNNNNNNNINYNERHAM